MGSEVADCAGARRFTIRVAGTQPLAGVELLRNNAVIWRAEPGELTAWADVTDEDPVEEVLLEPAFGGELPFCFYYLRVRQIDGEMAWSSPIWVTA